MHMLLLIGVSVGFALSVLTSNNFYSEKVFTSSVNQVVCNEMKSDGCRNLIAQASDLPQMGGQWYYEGRSVSSSSQSWWNRLWAGISNFFRRFF
jgi:hypothetical protein